MNSELKKDLCDFLIKNNLVKPYQVICHSYTTNRMGGGYLKYDKNINICPCITTRCDTLGVVVIDKRGNNE